MKKRIGPKKVLKTASDSKPEAKRKKAKSQEFVIEKDKPSKKVPKLEAEEVLPRPKKGETKKMAKMTAQLQNQLAVIGDLKPKAVERTIAENFGESAPQIVQMLEMNDNDGAIIILQKRLLQSSIAMLVHAESLMTETKGAKGTYQYATLVSQIRELITDIQAARDRSFIANQIMQQILQPAFIDMAEMIMNEHSAFRKDLLDDDIVPEKHVARFNTALKDLARGMAQKMQVKYRDVEMKLMQQLTS